MTMEYHHNEQELKESLKLLEMVEEKIMQK